jgi:hypothetical protein
MNATRTAILASLVITASTASMSAFAQKTHGDAYEPMAHAGVSTLTRAQVQAEAALSPKVLNERETFAASPAPEASTLSRSEVRAEAISAMAEQAVINNRG